jgi:hypothetical protein
MSIMPLSLPIYNFAVANVGLEHWPTEQYYLCCGKSICGGCAYSFIMKSGHIGTCAFCKADIIGKTDEEIVEELMKRVEANDACAILLLGNQYAARKRVVAR